jgi:3-dehydroquinate synthase
VKRARVTVATRRPYEVEIGPGAMESLAEALGGAPAAVLCDTNVERLHASALGPARALPRLALAPGEAAKSFATLEQVLGFLLEAGLERNAKLVVFGGGVLGDLGGLAAALFLRGIEFVACPTTLLAQVDSSVGGKTAVNLRGGKNLAGVVHQPARVLADTALLATLPDEELRSGLGEVVKSALIGDAGLFALLERDSEQILARDAERLAELVSRCVRVKAAIVARDETERGERKLLNLGHTFAHAIERAAGYGTVPHGIAVGVGCVLATRLSARLGRLDDPELPERLTRLLTRLGMPSDLAELRTRCGARLTPAELQLGMRHDKKNRSGRPAFVVPRGLGRVEWDQEADPELVATLLE